MEIERLTAAGRGAVAVLEIHCSDGTCLDDHFQAANGLSAATAHPNRILYGHWGHEDVVVVRTAAERWEVHCHGGEAAVQRITEDLQRSAAAAAPDFLSDGPVCSDDTEFSGHRVAAAQERGNNALLSQLLKCRTQRTAAFLLVQYQGTLQRFVDRMLSDPPPADRARQLERFLNWQSFTDHLTQPWPVAIVGQPNAGKSSLLNAIVGYERSIVFDQPGTTRDLVEADIVLDGWPIRVVDTAGIRSSSQDMLEQVGVTAARNFIRTCEACVLVVDAVVGWTPADHELLEAVLPDTPVAIVLNKVDLSEAQPQMHQSRERAVSAVNARSAVPPDGPFVFHTSATTQQGLEELLDWLPTVLVPQLPNLHEPLPVLPEVVRQMQTLRRS